MKRLKAVLVLLLLINLGFTFRITQGLEEAQRAVVKAYRAGAKEKAPYLYSKTKAYKDISAILASEEDDIGSKIFAIRTMNYASKAISAAFSGMEELTPIEHLPERVVDIETDFYFPEEEEEVVRDASRLKLPEGVVVDIGAIHNRLDFLRENRGIRCSPRELGRAEAFYDALVYEARKKEPNSALLLRFFNMANTESRVAESKLRVAIENEFECYTGKKKVVKLPGKPAEGKPKEEPEEEHKPEMVEEYLKITARIHFDFDKYNIKEEYVPILNEVVKTLKENPFVKVRIEGFTDIIGSKEYNEKLALKRAEAVKKYLVEHGIPEEKIEIVGFGKERFIATNEDPIGRLTNRRVEFIVLKVQEE